MTRMTAFALACTVGLALTPRAEAQSKDQGPVVVGEQSTMRATITAIDHAHRTVTLKDPKGKTMDLIVDDAVTRFDALKIGDNVMAGYTESMRFEIQPPGTPVAPDSVVRRGGKYEGDKPGGAAADSMVRTVTITAIDAAKPEVTFKNADGGTETYKVRHPEYLNRFKVGDQVKVTKTTSLLVRVDPAK